MEQIVEFAKTALEKAFNPLVTLYGDRLTTQQRNIILTPTVNVASNPKFGDFQVNNTMPIMKLIKELKVSEPDIVVPATYNTPVAISNIIANSIKECDPEKHVIETVAPAGIFVNIFLSASYYVDKCRSIYLDNATSAGLPKAPEIEKKHVVVDFSSPNIAKSMHVGHLRSTIIGDTICRIFEYVGYETERINHVGDWGTQFGMLIANLQDKVPEFFKEEGAENSVHLPIEDLVEFYKQAKMRFDEEPEFAKRAHEEVVKLQAGEKKQIIAWKALCEVSRIEFERIYNLLDVKLTEVGESFYNPMLASTIELLSGLTEESDGAMIIRIDGIDYPLILRKRDGAATYDTTDMAAIHYRVFDRHADRIIYVTDAGQSSHFDLVFAAAKKAGWIDQKNIVAEHVPFGVVLGDDGKRLKTRSGETVKLMDLLKEAVFRAEAQMSERQSEMSKEEIHSISQAVGIGAVKYADLSNQRTRDYKFSFEKMLSFKGNTAAYMMYSLARISSITRKLGIDRDLLYTPEYVNSIVIEHPTERALITVLSKIHEVIKTVITDLMPNRICDFMYSVALAYTDFYEKCRVIDENGVANKSRLVLCEMTRQALRVCFQLLGLREVERM